MDAADVSQERTLHVGNVPSYVDENAMRQLFGGYGKIATMRSGGKPNHMTRYWFIEFSGRRDATAALVLNGTLLGDRELRVSLAQTPRIGGSGHQGQGHGRHPMSMTPPHLIGPHNPAILPDQSLPIQLPGYPIMATLFMGNPPPMTNGRSFGNNSGGSGRMAANSRHSREKVSRTVFVEGIAGNASVEEIARYFASCGTVVAVRVSDTCASSRRAWVEFETREAAGAALELTRQPFMECHIQVRSSRTAICTNALTKPVSLEDDIDEGCGPIRKLESSTSSARKFKSRDRDRLREHSEDSNEKKACHRDMSPNSGGRSEGNENMKFSKEEGYDSDGRRKRQYSDEQGGNSSGGRKHRRTEKQVSWWEKEGKYKK
ncbi:hypothetical protein BSKO_13529 [Bryopsis sp. KO-2023]|nr:hypothetical protein BSKO_13529 [Bryopsis sp. KO-2023]